MTFGEFLESFFAALRRGVPPGTGVPGELSPLGDFGKIRSLVEETRIFHLETEADDFRFIQEVASDLFQDLQQAIPIPFDNMAIVQPQGGSVEGQHRWWFRWILRLDGLARWEEEAGGDEKHFLVWTYVSGDDIPPHFWSAIRFWYRGGPGVDFRLSEASVYRHAEQRGIEPAQAKEGLRTLVLGTLLQCAAISHPANYLVEREPVLTPREARRVARGEPRPDQKRRHFIVVDYERLVELNPATRGTGRERASPVPHARRGHWRQLAERCRRARAEGRKRIWVGPTYVGQREFSDGKNHYRVHLPSSPERGREPGGA